MLYVFFWVIPRRLNFICRRFGALCLFHLHRQVGRYLPTCLWRWNRQSVLKRRHIKFRRREITQKKTYNIQNTAKVWNQEHYNVTNSINLANDLTKLEIHENHRMITLDIKDLYVNIPTDETLDIMKARLLQNNDTQITHQILSLLRAILSQNCFTFQQKIYRPNQGISMGSPISSLTHWHTTFYNTRRTYIYIYIWSAYSWCF